MKVSRMKNIDVADITGYEIFNLSLKLFIPRKKSCKSIIIKLGFSFHHNGTQPWVKIYLFFWTFFLGK